MSKKAWPNLTCINFYSAPDRRGSHGTLAANGAGAESDKGDKDDNCSDIKTDDQQVETSSSKASQSAPNSQEC